MDYLTLKSLRIEGKHGVDEQERIEGNIFEVDLIFGLDLAAAAASDDLDKTVDYQAAERMVSKVIHGPSVLLIETLTKRIGDRLFEAFPSVISLEVRVRKMDPPLETETRYSEVTMKWQR